MSFLIQRRGRLSCSMVMAARITHTEIGKSSAARAGQVTVRPLRAGDWPVIEELFGPNGACGGCWCMWWRLPRGGKLWQQSKGARNKLAFKKLVTAGQVHGVLAFAGDNPVGWCCIGPRSNFPRLERSKALRTDWKERTWSVVCFYVRAGWRGRGVAGALLEAAVKLARKLGAAELEAYPVRRQEGGRKVSPAFAWTGFAVLFERYRFVNVTPPGNSRDIYTKPLARARHR